MSSTSARAPACTAGKWSPTGTPAEIVAAHETLTGQYLVGGRQIPLPLSAGRPSAATG